MPPKKKKPVSQPDDLSDDDDMVVPSEDEEFDEPGIEGDETEEVLDDVMLDEEDGEGGNWEGGDGVEEEDDGDGDEYTLPVPPVARKFKMEKKIRHYEGSPLRSEPDDDIV